MMMEAGANATSVNMIVQMLARGLGAERVDLRIGYASLAITVQIADAGVTQMRTVGILGVDQRLAQGLWGLAKRAAKHEVDVEQSRAELVRLANQTPHHPGWIVAAAVGLGCVAFGRLLGVDWPGSGSVFLAASVGQYIRSMMLRWHVNPFLTTGLTSFIASLLGGLGARLLGSATLIPAMIASILLPVPGVPAVNAQSDILEGHPTLGSARAVSVAMTLIFVAIGLWLGYASLPGGR